MSLATATREASAVLRDAVDEAARDELDRVVREAQSAWPSDTGASAASLRVTTTPPGVYSDLRYTEYIHGGRTWSELVVTPAEAAAEQIARRAAATVSITLGRA